MKIDSYGREETDPLFGSGQMPTPGEDRTIDGINYVAFETMHKVVHRISPDATGLLVRQWSPGTFEDVGSMTFTDLTETREVDG